MDPETFELLKKIVGLSREKETEMRNVSIYDLIDLEKRTKGDTEESVKSIIQRAYRLAEMGLVSIKPLEGDEGLETMLLPTGLGNAYVEFQNLSGGG